jgi:hypothetical protein
MCQQGKFGLWRFDDNIDKGYRHEAYGGEDSTLLGGNENVRVDSCCAYRNKSNSVNRVLAEFRGILCTVCGRRSEVWGFLFCSNIVIQFSVSKYFFHKNYMGQ